VFEDAGRQLREAGASVRDIVLPAAVRRTRRRAAYRHGARGRAIAVARMASRIGPAEPRDGRHDRSRSRGVIRALRRGAEPGSKLPARRSRLCSTASKSCSRRAPKARRRKGSRRPATRCSTGCGRCCIRRLSICRSGGAARFAGRHHNRGTVGADRATLGAAGLDLREARTAVNTNRRPVWLEAGSLWALSPLPRAAKGKISGSSMLARHHDQRDADGGDVLNGKRHEHRK
jgi:hypothetical protein